VSTPLTHAVPQEPFAALKPTHVCVTTGPEAPCDPPVDPTSVHTRFHRLLRALSAVSNQPAVGISPRATISSRSPLVAASRLTLYGVAVPPPTRLQLALTIRVPCARSNHARPASLPQQRLGILFHLFFFVLDDAEQRCPGCPVDARPVPPRSPPASWSQTGTRSQTAPERIPRQHHPIAEQLGLVKMYPPDSRPATPAFDQSQVTAFTSESPAEIFA